MGVGEEVGYSIGEYGGEKRFMAAKCNADVQGCKIDRPGPRHEADPQ